MLILSLHIPFIQKSKHHFWRRHCISSHINDIVLLKWLDSAPGRSYALSLELSTPSARSSQVRSASLYRITKSIIWKNDDYVTKPGTGLCNCSYFVIYRWIGDNVQEYIDNRRSLVPFSVYDWARSPPMKESFADVTPLTGWDLAEL